MARLHSWRVAKSLKLLVRCSYQLVAGTVCIRALVQLFMFRSVGRQGQAAVSSESVLMLARCYLRVYFSNVNRLIWVQLRVKGCV